MPVKFIAEVSEGHGGDLARAERLIAAAAAAGADAVKFRLSNVELQYAPEILSLRPELRLGADELAPAALAHLRRVCGEHGLALAGAPGYLRAVAELEPHVDFFRISSHELLWGDLLAETGATGKPVMLSTGMSTMPEIRAAVAVLESVGARDISLLHCVSAHPAPVRECNLATVETMRGATGLPVGWSDHTREPAVIERAVGRWCAEIVEFHLALDAGAPVPPHCWTGRDIAPVIERIRRGEQADGRYLKAPADAELAERMWRADPEDGLRPMREIRAGAESRIAINGR